MYKLQSAYMSIYNKYIDKDIREFRLECSIATESNISSIKIEHDLLSGAEEYTIGNLATTKLTMVVSSNVVVNEGDEINLTLYLKTQETDERGKLIEIPIGLGRFFVFDVSRTTLTKTLIAYNDLYKRELEKEFISSKVYPVSVYDLLSEICEILHINFSYDNLPNEIIDRPEYVPDFVLNDEGNYEEVESNSKQACFGMNVGQALSYIAGYLGGNFIIDGKNELKFIKISTNTKDVVKSFAPNSYTSPSFEEAVYKIDTIHCTVSTGAVESVGDNTGAFLAFENPFYTRDRLLKSLLPTMSKITYSPARVRVKGDPRLELGDLIGIQNMDNSITYIPILRMNFSYTGGCSVEVESVCKAEAEKSINYKGSISSKIDSLEHSISAANKKIDTISESLNTLRDVKQNVDDINDLIDSVSNDLSVSNLSRYNRLLELIESNSNELNEQYRYVYNNKYLQ